MSLPSWMMGLPDTLMSSRGQKNFVFFCGFYAFLQVKGRFFKPLTAILKIRATMAQIFVGCVPIVWLPKILPIVPELSNDIYG